MTSFKYFLIASTLLIGVFVSCIPDQSGIPASLGEKFTLGIGQTAYIKDTNIEIGFLKVIEDSRCPKDVTCIWAGQVSCLIEISENTSTQITITQSGSSESGENVYKSFRLIYSIQPYPISGKKISPQEYRLIMTVEKL